ncbi:MAG: SDR family oxidoreductase [Pseudomonadota bacterium]
MKTVLITGASQGIGAASAELFWEAGWHVGLLARNGAALQALAEGRAATVLPCDVADAVQVRAAFARFAEAVGHLDVLVNNAGTFGPQGDPDTINVEDFRRVMEVNVQGMFLCAREAFAQMKRQEGGRIVMNGSISAQSPREGSIVYTTAKHAISGMTKSLSLDGRAWNITCGQIDIGNARTEMVRDLEGRRRAEGLEPLPAMDVRHAAEAIVHMASLPPEANIQQMTILASKMPFVGRG